MIWGQNDNVYRDWLMSQMSFYAQRKHFFKIYVNYLTSIFKLFLFKFYKILAYIFQINN